MLLEWVTQLWWDPKALQRHFVLPSFPSEELCFVMYTPRFVLLLLFSLACQLTIGKKPFSKKRKLLECVERWSHSGLSPLRGALFSEQSQLCLSPSQVVFWEDHRQTDKASWRWYQRVGSPAAPVVTDTGIARVSLHICMLHWIFHKTEECVTRYADIFRCALPAKE